MSTKWTPTIGEARRWAARHRDVMALASIECLAQVEDDIEQREGWDVAPSLLFAYRAIAPVVDGLDMMGFRYSRLPVHLGDDGTEIAWKLRQVAKALVGEDSAARDALLPDDLFGLALLHEGWTLDPLPESEEAYHLEQERCGGDLGKHPNRVEVRTIYLVDNTDRVVMVTRRRGQAPMERTVIIETDEARMGGQMVDGLRAMTRAALGARSEEEAFAGLEYVT